MHDPTKSHSGVMQVIHSFIHCVDIVVVIILDFVFLYNSQSPNGV
jgi:hypothetical protein